LKTDLTFSEKLGEIGKKIEYLTVYGHASNLKLCTHICQKISILDPPYIGLFGPSWSELSPYGWIGRVTGQLADMPTRRQPTRTQVKSRTIQLAHTATRRLDN